MDLWLPKCGVPYFMGRLLLRMPSPISIIWHTVHPTQIIFNDLEARGYRKPASPMVCKLKSAPHRHTSQMAHKTASSLETIAENNDYY